MMGTWWHTVQELQNQVCEEGSFPDINIGAFRIEFGVPYFSYSKISPKTLF